MRVNFQVFLAWMDLVLDMNSHYSSSDWAKFKHNNQPELCMCKLNQ